MKILKLLVIAISLMFVANKSHAQLNMTMTHDTYINIGVGSDGDYHSLIELSSGEQYALMTESDISDFSGETLTEGWYRVSRFNNLTSNLIRIKVAAGQSIKLVEDSYGNVYVFWEDLTSGSQTVIGSH